MEHFYIAVINNYILTQHQSNSYHIERILKYEDVLTAIQNYMFHNEDYNFVIITNDKKLLSIYKFCLNIDEFKMLCRQKVYDKNKITINEFTYKDFSESAYKYFQKVYSEDIISANMNYEITSEWEGQYTESCLGWLENKEFKFLKNKYVKGNWGNDEDIFYIPRYETISIEEIDEIFSINLIEEIDLNGNKIPWTFQNNVILYFNKENKIRLYASEKLVIDIHSESRKIGNPFISQTKLPIKISVEIELSKSNYVCYRLKNIIR